MTAFVVSPAGAAAAPVLAALIDATMGAGWSADSIARLMALPGAFALVAAPGAGGAPVGLCLVVPSADGYDIAALGVVSAWRRRGIGQALVRAALARAPALALDVAADNAPALALYRRLGFFEIGRRPGYYARAGAAADALVLAARSSTGR
jgi:ribosomal-protein-alanine N-acetyltransferase